MTKETAKKPERRRMSKPRKGDPSPPADAKEGESDDDDYPEFGKRPRNYDPDECLAFAQRVLNWMMIRMEKRPDHEDSAADRARDARTLTELARTLERLDALERRKIKQRKKTHARDNAELKTDLIRRMDKLLAASRKNGAAGEPDAG